MPEREIVGSICLRASKSFMRYVLSPHNQFLNAVLSLLINPKLEVSEIAVQSIEPYQSWTADRNDNKFHLIA